MRPCSRLSLCTLTRDSAAHLPDWIERLLSLDDDEYLSDPLAESEA